VSRPARNALIVVGALVLLIGGFAIAQGSGKKSAPSPAAATTSATSTAPATTSPTATSPRKEAGHAQAGPAEPTVVVQGGKPKGGVQDLKFEKGDDVRFTVRSDVADEIHVHGFDLMKDVTAGGSVAFDFPAKFDGEFEVELEGRGVQIASLQIQP
jgi:hypothetical protein